MAVAGGGIVMGEKRCSEFFVTKMKIEIIFPKKNNENRDWVMEQIMGHIVGFANGM
jgi:hypothetical protein